MTEVFYPQVHGANQRGSAIMTLGWGDDPPKSGDVVSFSDTFGLDPHTREPVDWPRQHFIVTQADSRVNERGVIRVALRIYPALKPEEPWRNVSSSPADGARVFVEKRS